MTDREAGLERIRAARQTPEFLRMRTPGYVRMEGKRIVQVMCKRCGTIIKQADRRGELQPAPDYAELRILFRPQVRGGAPTRHVTPICAECRGRGLTLAELEAIYCADLAQWAFEADQQGHQLRWELLAKREISGWEPCDAGTV
jgi:hypothetical protein